MNIKVKITLCNLFYSYARSKSNIVNRDEPTNNIPITDKLKKYLFIKNRISYH